MTVTPHITVPDQTPFREYTVTSSSTVFAFQFTFFDKTDLRVTHNQIEYDQEEFEVTGTTGFEGGYPGGSVILDAAVSSGVIQIWSSIIPARLTDFTQGAGLPNRSINTEIDRLVVRQRDTRLRMQRIPTLATTLDRALTVADCGQLWTNKGASGALAYTLPPASAGLIVMFAVVAAQTLTINADTDGSDVIYNGTSSGTSVAANAIGSNCVIRGTDLGTWQVFSSKGTWT